MDTWTAPPVRIVLGLTLLLVATATASACTAGRPTGVPATTTAPASVEPSPSPPAPSASPQAGADSSGAEIPVSALLQAVDVGPGVTVFDEGRGGDEFSLNLMLFYCGQTPYSAAKDHVVAIRDRSLTQSEEAYVHTTVVRYASGWAARHLSDLRAVLPRCQQVDPTGYPYQRVTLTTVATNFAGDESLLVKESVGAQTQYHAIVRQGDVEAHLRVGIRYDEDAARTLATAAARRLCDATPTC
jgi:hypothetical protein